MHKTTLPHASRIFPALAALTALLFFSGCASMTITNLTPDKVPANPSQIYTITASFHTDNSNIAPASIKPRIIIDGSSYPMTKSTVGGDIWEFDYQLPTGRTVGSYYFLVDYASKVGQGVGPTIEASSELQTIRIEGRYVLRPEATRAPMGARVSVLGAGFTPQDVVYFETTPTRTVFESPSSLSFFVPAVEAGKNYRLHIGGGGGDLAVGSFRVDAISFDVSPSSLRLRSGEQQALTFTIPNPAPAGGMLIDVTTDAPESIVMPEVMVPAGQTSVTVAIQGGKPGSGSLFFKSSAGESSVPVTVTK
ncbi:MAG: cell surface protein [Opitutae bacterium]|nr:cell surface protein [Opitutae bacterium]